MEKEAKLLEILDTYYNQRRVLNLHSADNAVEAVVALYSPEPQVCTEKQMMICKGVLNNPGCENCPTHEPHPFNKRGCPEQCLGGVTCIPFPSTPASVPLPPDELTDEKKKLLWQILNLKAELTRAKATSQERELAEAERTAGELLKENFDLKAQLLKCRQSEAAEIAELKQALVDDATDLWTVTNAIKKEIDMRSWILDGRGSYAWDDDKYKDETRIAFEAVMKIIANVQHPAQLRFEKVIGKFNGKSESAIRADQNKKIGEWGNEPCPHRNNDFPFPKAVPSELQMLKRECRDCWQEKFNIAKLQKGDKLDGKVTNVDGSFKQAKFTKYGE